MNPGLWEEDRWRKIEPLAQCLDMSGIELPFTAENLRDFCLIPNLWQIALG